jgi:hypothetical protein
VEVGFNLHASVAIAGDEPPRYPLVRYHGVLAPRRTDDTARAQRTRTRERAANVTPASAGHEAPVTWTTVVAGQLYHFKVERADAGNARQLRRVR